MTHYTQAYIEEQIAGNKRVRELHTEDNGKCMHCIDLWIDGELNFEFSDYPCQTIQLLDGEQ